MNDLSDLYLPGPKTLEAVRKNLIRDKTLENLSYLVEPEPMTLVWVKHSTAIVPERIVAQETFYTEFAARLFGWLTTVALGEYYHWWAFKKL